MKLTLALVAIAIVLYAYPFVAGVDLEQYYNTYGFSFATVAERPWTIVTSLFVHGSLEHLLSNVLVWLFFGFAVEKEVGMMRYLALFFAGAFVGDALSLLFYTPETLFIGASAGIFALIGAGMLLKPTDVSLYPLIVPVPLALLGMVYIVFNIYALFSDTSGNVSYIGHMGGIVVGFLYGFRRAGTRRSMIIIAVTATILAAALYVFYAVL